MTDRPWCNMKGVCFARDEDGKCKILMREQEGECSFQKPERAMTDGKYYPDAKATGDYPPDLPTRKIEETAREWDMVTRKLRKEREDEQRAC